MIEQTQNLLIAISLALGLFSFLMIWILIDWGKTK